ncbi:L-rhamnose isomerase [Salmonella bongori]|nr:L-rhamnose isomerase [Salmonella bongori]
MKKALLRALLEPTKQLRQLEASGDYTARLALLEEQKSLPWQAVWKCTASAMIRLLAANGWKAYEHTRKRF